MAGLFPFSLRFPAAPGQCRARGMRTVSDSAEHVECWGCGRPGAFGASSSGCGSKAGRVLCKGKLKASPRIGCCGADAGSFASSFNPAGWCSLPCDEPGLAAAAAPRRPAAEPCSPARWAVPALPVPPGCLPVPANASRCLPGASRPPGAAGAQGAPLSGARGPRRREWSLAVRSRPCCCGPALPTLSLGQNSPR